MIALYDLNRPAELEAEAARQAALLASGDYPKDRQAQVHFIHGLAEFRAGKWAEARAHYEKAVAHSSDEDPFGTWAQLHLGNLLDLTGDRKAARQTYREVKRMLNRWGTARLADRYLDDPFDPAVDRVRLLPD
jgi:tetratricopeptide (TPR) repeat protein